jgi:poly(beta-D-mannuronate) lyase
VAEPVIERGFSSRSVRLETSPNGLKWPADEALAAVGARRDLAVISRDATGVDWYPKPEFGPRFGGGKVVRVGPAEGELERAVAAAGAGDIIELAAGEYVVRRLLNITAPLTVRAVAGGEKPLIAFERTALFEIQDGGSLQLQGLAFSGESAPDNPGNSLLRTSRYSMLNDYQLLVEDCAVGDLDVNHSFNFLTVSKGTLADRIEIRGSTFSGISGAILELDKETDDLGLYNAEYVTIRDSFFRDVGEALAVLYRGGTDESTFGPHFELSGSTLENVGRNKRNKSGASVSLLGVQLADVVATEFTDSAPLVVTQTVGDPITKITSNRFERTAEPDIRNGEARVEDNTVVR